MYCLEDGAEHLQFRDWRQGDSANYRRAHNRLREQNQRKDIDRFSYRCLCFIFSATPRLCPLGLVVSLCEGWRLCEEFAEILVADLFLLDLSYALECSIDLVLSYALNDTTELLLVLEHLLCVVS